MAETVKGLRNGYRVVFDPNRDRWNYEHRVVMEAHLGRMLDRSEIVHHLNHDKLDNRVENLSLTTRGEHNTHHTTGRTWPHPSPLRKPDIPCAWCGEPFHQRATRLKCCSLSCGQRLRYARLRGAA